MTSLHLTLRQLQIFAAVARHGSTVGAAQGLALSQSATSAALNELERLLGTALFDRAGKRLVLNEGGRTLLPRARALLDGAADLERLAQDPAAQLQSLRLGASTTIGNYVLPQLLASLYGPAPHADGVSWHSRIMIANTAAIGRAVAEFDLDLGLVEGPVTRAEVETTPWLRDEMVVAAAIGGPHLPEPVPLRALRDSVWLLREPGSGTREVSDQALLPHLKSYRRSIELGSSEAIRQAAALGLGLCLLSRWVVADFVAAGRLRILQTHLPRLYRPCHVIRHRDKPPTPSMAAVLARLGQCR